MTDKNDTQPKKLVKARKRHFVRSNTGIHSLRDSTHKSKQRQNTNHPPAPNSAQHKKPSIKREETKKHSLEQSKTLRCGALGSVVLSVDSEMKCYEVLWGSAGFAGMTGELVGQVRSAAECECVEWNREVDSVCSWEGSQHRHEVVGSVCASFVVAPARSGPGASEGARLRSVHKRVTPRYDEQKSQILSPPQLAVSSSCPLQAKGRNPCVVTYNVFKTSSTPQPSSCLTNP